MADGFLPSGQEATGMAGMSAAGLGSVGTGNFLMNRLKGATNVPAGQASMDPGLRAAVQQQQQAAQQYRSNLGNLQSQQYEGAAQEARKNLAGRMADIKSGASSRGLLYSGLRQGAEAGAAAESAGGLAAQRANINKSTEQTAQQMENQAVQSGIGLQQQQQGINDYNYNQQLKAQQQQRGVMGAIGGAAGGLIGTGMGAK